MNELTVIIPLFNQEKYIEQCLRSIMKQQISNLNILIVDDGSTDESYSICERLSKEDNRIKIIRQNNKGLSGARKTGIENCYTEYVTFVDADDFILNNAYDKAVPYMQRDIDMIFYEIARYYSDDNIKYEHHVLPEGYYDRENIEKVVCPRLVWDFERGVPGIECSQCVRIVKRKILLEQYNKSDGYFYYGEDMRITYPLYLSIKDMQVISQCYYMHRQRRTDIPPYIKSNDYLDKLHELYGYLNKSFLKAGAFDRFRSQIEYSYMYSVNLRKLKYGDYYYTREFLFPFDKVEKGKRIILYGAGNVGKTFYKQLNKLNYCNSILWVDRNATEINDTRVKQIEDMFADVCEYDYVVIAIENNNVCCSIKDWMISKGIDKDKIIY